MEPQIEEIKAFLLAVAPVDQRETTPGCCWINTVVVGLEKYTETRRFIWRVWIYCTKQQTLRPYASFSVVVLYKRLKDDCRKCCRNVTSPVNIVLYPRSQFVTLIFYSANSCSKVSKSTANTPLGIPLLSPSSSISSGAVQSHHHMSIGPAMVHEPNVALT